MTSGLPHIKTKAREMYAAGASTEAIAGCFRVTRRTVQKWVAGTVCPASRRAADEAKRRESPDYLQGKRASVEFARMMQARRREDLKLIPEWAKRAGLTDDYIRIARLHGEEAAASACRKLKAVRAGAVTRGQIQSSQFGAVR
jgi:hypothetical protein